MGLDSLTSTLEINAKWSAQKNITNRNPLVQSDSLRKAQNNGTANANNTSGGADEVVSYNLTVGANTSATVDLTAVTDVLQQTVNLARIKGYTISLLSYAQDPVYGTNCSGVTVGNAAATQQNLNLGVNSTLTLDPGSTVGYTTPKAAGIAVSGSAKSLKIANNDVTNAAAVQITILGATN